jgi:hypothetical protein
MQTLQVLTISKPLNSIEQGNFEIGNCDIRSGINFSVLNEMKQNE